MKPKFDKYYKGEWEYESSYGVGLKLVGKPNNIEDFLELLHEQSCNPVAARRVLDELITNGEKYTTLMYQVNFNFIGDELKRLGVDMIIIPPVDPVKVNNGKTDQLAFNIVYHGVDINEIIFKNDEEKLEVLRKANEFSSGKKEFNRSYGPYDRNPEVSSNAIESYKRKTHNYR